jgi:RNA recognition motif-containing protein
MTTVFVGNLVHDVTSRELEREFDRYGRIRDLWIARKPAGFAFITYGDERDAKDAVYDMDGRTLFGRRIRVEISTRGRGGDRGGDSRRSGAPTRTEFRVKISGVPSGVNWRDLKDWIREVADPCYADITSGGDAVAEFKSEEDAERVVSRLDDQEFKGARVRISRTLEGGAAGSSSGGNGGGSGRGRDRRASRSRSASPRGGRDRSRSRSRDRSRSRSRSRSGGRN